MSPIISKAGRKCGTLFIMPFTVVLNLETRKQSLFLKENGGREERPWERGWTLLWGSISVTSLKKAPKEVKGREEGKGVDNKSDRKSLY